MGTYTFVVEGGDDKEFPAGYHPFYITDDPEGGYEFKSERERRRSRVFAGVEQTRFGGVVLRLLGGFVSGRKTISSRQTSSLLSEPTRGLSVSSAKKGNPASCSGPRTGTRQTRSTTSASLTGSSAGRSTWWTGVTSERPEDNCDDSSDQQC